MTRPTIFDLAREAGVSRSTVSRAVSGRGYVAASVRARVQDAALQLGYVPMESRAACVTARRARSVS